MPQRLSFQLYSARKFEPWGKILPMLAKVGYTEVEGFGGVYGNPAAFRAELEAHGLAMPTGHFPIEMLEGDRKKVLAIAGGFAMRHIYCPFVAPDMRPKSGAGWKAFGKRLAVINAWARSEGYGFGWHNHDFEFRKLKDGSMPHERIFDAAPNLDWEIDVAWVAFTGQNPLKWIKAYGASITAVHIKDNAPKGENLDQHGQSDVGDGTVKWPEIFKALRNTRALYMIMEHDDPKDVNSFARRSFEFSRKH